MAHGSDHHVSTATDSRKIARVGMTGRHGGVASGEERRNRSANHERTPNDRHLGAIELHPVMVEGGDDGLGRARGKAGTTAGKRGKKRTCRHAVDVLGGVERRGRGILIKVRR